MSLCTFPKTLTNLGTGAKSTTQTRIEEKYYKELNKANSNFNCKEILEEIIVK